MCASARGSRDASAVGASSAGTSASRCVLPAKTLPTIAQPLWAVIVDNLRTTGGSIHNFAGRVLSRQDHIRPGWGSTPCTSARHSMVHPLRYPQSFAHLWITPKHRVCTVLPRTTVRQEHVPRVTNIGALPGRISTITVTAWWPMAFREMGRFTHRCVGLSAAADNSRHCRAGQLHIPPPRGRAGLQW